MCKGMGGVRLGEGVVKRGHKLISQDGGNDGKEEGMGNKGWTVDCDWHVCQFYVCF